MPAVRRAGVAAGRGWGRRAGGRAARCARAAATRRPVLLGVLHEGRHHRRPGRAWTLRGRPHWPAAQRKGPAHHLRIPHPLPAGPGGWGTETHLLRADRGRPGLPSATVHPPDGVAGHQCGRRQPWVRVRPEKGQLFLPQPLPDQQVGRVSHLGVLCRPAGRRGPRQDGAGHPGLPLLRRARAGGQRGGRARPLCVPGGPPVALRAEGRGMEGERGRVRRGPQSGGRRLRGRLLRPAGGRAGGGGGGGSRRGGRGGPAGGLGRGRGGERERARLGCARGWGCFLRGGRHGRVRRGAPRLSDPGSGFAPPGQPAAQPGGRDRTGCGCPALQQRARWWWWWWRQRGSCACLLPLHPARHRRHHDRLPAAPVPHPRRRGGPAHGR